MTGAVVAARAIVLVLALLLVLGALHKARLLAAGRVATVSLLPRWIPSRRAGAVLAVAAVGEVALAALVVLAPVVGLPAVTALLLVYGAVLRGRAADEPCECFGEMLPMTNRVAVVRNVVLAVAAGGAAAVAATHDLRTNLVTQGSAGVALLVFAAIAGAALGFKASASVPGILDQDGRN